MVVRQGDVFWVTAKAAVAAGHGRRPCIVVQSDAFNDAVGTVVVCYLTSKTSRAGSPGNVALRAGEGNLPKSSVVNITHLETLYKDELGDKIGQVSFARVGEIFDGLKLLLQPSPKAYRDIAR